MSSLAGPAIQAGGSILGGLAGGKNSGGTKAPKWLRQGARQLGEFGSQLGQTPYQAYTGDRVAGFSPDTLAAFDHIRGNVGAAAPAYQSAMGTAQGLTSYQPQQVGNVNASQWAGGDLSPYMNPYIDNVINANAADQQNAYGQQYNQLASQAQSAGAFGGSRFGVAQGQLGADSVRNQALLSAQLRSQGFDTAAGLMGQDVASQNWAKGLNQQGAIANQSADLQGAQLRGNAAGLLSSTAGQYQNSLAEDARSLAGAGSAQQALAQQGLDVGYNDYWDQTRNYPSQQMAWWSGGLSPGIAAAGLAAPSTGGGAMGALGGAMLGSQLGGSIYDWYKGQSTGTTPTGATGNWNGPRP
jgi:hypothetical protein